MPRDPLNRFHAPVSAWFRDVFAEPTVVQNQAWEAISEGNNALVVAPTGSGKTLAAFLWSLSELTKQPLLQSTTESKTSQAGTRVLYVSPLKALGVDVDRNLAAPLAGIARTAAAMGETVATVRVGVRSGDTPASERAKMLRNPPEILITTPESLYLMLTSKAAGTLRGVETVIVDEVHAVAGTKRGTHLALSLERLELVTGKPVQRIGLSATVNPIDTVASFLGGDRPVTVVHPKVSKSWDVQVRSVVEDFQDPPVYEDVAAARYEDAGGVEDEGEGTDGTDLIDEALLGPSLMGEGLGGNTQVGSGSRVASGVDKESALPQQKSVWPHVQRSVYEQIMENRSTLVFVNSRRSAERLTGALNEEWAKEHDPEALANPTRRDPAQLMAQSTAVRGVEPIIARAHHGSVSKDERADIEEALKAGRLKCVVATSSLELGIDMGLVDHVIQVGAPPSVSAAIQRCGRAGHTVGATSAATIYPLHKQDAEAATVIVDRLLKGDLEPLHVVNNAMDVLAQQTVAAAVQAATLPPLMGDELEESAGSTAGETAGETAGKESAVGALDVEQWWRTVRRAHPFAALPREAFDAVIELMSGHYPSTDFADLKARVTYDPAAGTLEARPGTQRIAVTSGGTIPDRGMFGVFLAAGEETGARRVGELDEEMVYESRVGDVFTLGASSWRILEITRDQVIVAPAAGHTGRLPFWTGDAEGRPIELGKAIGQHRRQWGTGSLEDLKGSEFLCDNTRSNLDAYYSAQKESAGVIPDEKTLLIERFRDEIGDWRVVIHSPFGRSINAPWAMALAAQLQRETGIDAMAVAGDDGMVLRLPYSEEPPGLGLLLASEKEEEQPALSGEAADNIVADVMDNVGSSALFAGRFRECAARALLLPRRTPGKRQPLWQQRQRAAQLLDVARNHPEFPVMVETMRECLHDVYDLDALKVVIRGLETRGGSEAIRVAEVTTESPSAFAESLLFTYTSAFLYEGDSAERAAALAVDPALLAKVLGTSGEGLLLDPRVIANVVDGAQWLAEGRRAVHVEQVVDMLRMLGPMTAEQVLERRETPDASTEDPLADVRSLVPQRLAEVSFGGALKLAAVEDLPLLRDGLGVPVPPGSPADPKTVPDALDQLLLRWARHSGPFTAANVAAEFGLGVATSDSLLRRWVADRRLESGTFVLVEDNDATQYVDVGMLRRLRSATLAAARGALEPVSRRTYATFLSAWHGLHESEREDLLSVIEQLAGVPLPASAWETVVLPARIANYRPEDLDELLSTGEVIAVGAGTAGANDPLVMLLPAELAPALLEPENGGDIGNLVATQILEHVSRGGAFLASELEQVTGAEHTEIDAAMWELFDASLLVPDSFAAIRRRLVDAGSGGKSAHRAPRRDRGRGSQRRLRMGRTSFAQAAKSEEARARRQAINAHASVPGRWAAVPMIDSSPADRAVAKGEAWMDRYGVVTRGSIVSEKSPGGFAEAYRTLSAWEDSGIVLRGYVVEGLGGAQFAPKGVINQLRRMEEGTDKQSRPAESIILAASDPANPFGAALPWPELAEGIPTPHRGAGALVIVRDGEALAHLTRGARGLTVLGRKQAVSFGDEEAGLASNIIAHIVDALTAAVRSGRLAPVVLERIDGVGVLELDARPWTQAGARLTPKGLSIK